jgi:poly(hydroxyalkanoate) depolymerase family esterase
MTRNRKCALAIASLAASLLVAGPARAASLTMVPRATWGATNVPSYMQMYIYVPDKLATKPPIFVSCHSCGSTATGQMSNIPMAKAAADQYGFIMILPDNPGQNCWDVETTASLRHDGGGDTQGVAEMVKYTITRYNADASRVYIMGGSGGAMLTQAMLAVYPDVFRAGSARAGVPAGCWADGYSSSNQWSSNCANGNTIKTAQQWGDLVRAMDPGYSGHRPRLQTYQGDADGTISYKNTGEAIKEWTNVLGLPMAPTSTDTGYKAANATYNRQFWSNACGYIVLQAWTSPGGGHSMPYEEAEILKFFGLNQAVGGPDPEPNCTGDGGVSSGSGGASGTGGATGGGGAGGARDGGSAGATGSGGAVATGGTTGSGGAVATGGSTGSGGAATGGTPGTGTGGAAEGGSTGSGTGGATPSAEAGSTTGCTCAVGGGAASTVPSISALLMAALGLILRGRRRRNRG